MGKKIAVGMLLLGALIIFALTTFYIENWEAYVGEGGYTLWARFPTAQGVVKGDEVHIAGVPVGRVARLEVDTSGNVEKPVTITLWVRRTVTVREQDVAAIEIRSVFGGAYLSIVPGDPGAPRLEDGQEIKNVQIQASVAQLMARAEGTLTNAEEAFGKFGKAADGITEITTQVQEGPGLLPKLLTDEKWAEDMQALASDAGEVAASLKALSADLQEGKGPLGVMLKDEESAEKLKALIASAQSTFEGFQELIAQAREGKGLAARFLSDEELAGNVDQVAADIKEFSATLAKISEEFEGSTLQKIMTDDEAYNKLTSLLDNLNASAEALASGQGTLPMLLRDEKLYQDLAGAAENVQKMLDEYREQSPVLTFAGALFSAF